MIETKYSLSSMALSPKWADGQACYLGSLGKTVVLSPFAAEVLEHMAGSPHASWSELIDDLCADPSEVDIADLKRAINNTIDEFVRIGLLSVSVI